MPSFCDIRPFLEKRQQELFAPARAIAHAISKKREKGEKVPEKLCLLAGLMNESGVLIHPLTLDVCLDINANPLKIRGAPFRAYFHQLSGQGNIGGVFMDTGKGPGAVFLSLSVAMHLISGYLASNNLESVRVNQVGRQFLLGRMGHGRIEGMPKESIIGLAHHFIGSHLMESELGRMYAGRGISDYIGLVENALKSIAIHEAAHVLHKEAGIIRSGGVAREEERAYLTEMAFGNPAFSYAYLPTKKKDDPNCAAGKRIIESMHLRNGLAMLQGADRDMVSALAHELLDEGFVHDFGMHHDQMVSVLDIRRVQRHGFLDERHLPMVEGLRYLPEKKAA